MRTLHKILHTLKHRQQVRMRPIVLILMTLTLLTASPSPAVGLAETTFTAYLPLISVPDTRVLLGYDLRVSQGTRAEALLPALPATWARAGDLVWDAIEPQRGAYSWEAAAALEANIRRLRAAGVEPVVLVQIAPVWRVVFRGARAARWRPKPMRTWRVLRQRQRRATGAVISQYDTGSSGMNPISPLPSPTVKASDAGTPALRRGMAATPMARRCASSQTPFARSILARRSSAAILRISGPTSG